MIFQERSRFLSLIIQISIGVGLGWYICSKKQPIQKISETSLNTVLPNSCKTETKVISEQIVTRLNAWSSIESKTRNTVVQIFSDVAEFNWMQPYSTPNQQMASGSGFFIDNTGLIVTNAHVVNQAKNIYIQILYFILYILKFNYLKIPK